MRRILLALLAISPFALHAEWRHLSDSAFGTMSYDTSTTRAKDGRVQMRYRIDYATPSKGSSGKMFSSSVINILADCPAQTITLVDFSAYAKSGGAGEMVEKQAFPTSAAERVSPESSNQQLYNAACGKAAVPAAAAGATPAPKPTQ